jgi:hypothetical protein
MSQPETAEVHIEDWVMREQALLRDFVKYWQRGQRGRDPNGTPVEAFPEKMPLGEWDDQYRSWAGA